MQPKARPSLIPFFLVVTSATVLIGWSSFRIFSTLRLIWPQRLETIKPPQLDQMAADLNRLVAEQDVSMAGLRARSRQACEILSRYGPVSQHSDPSAFTTHESLGRARQFLSEACAMRNRFAHPLNWKERAAAGAEVNARLSRTLEAVQVAKTRLHPTPARLALAYTDLARIRDPLVELACGFVCLLFARRPRIELRSEPSDDQGWPAASEPASYQDTVLHLMDDSGAFFFSEVFDRAPVPMVLLDGAGRIVRLNAQAEAMAGMPSDELRGQFYGDTLVAEVSRESARTLHQVSDEGVPVAVTWTKKTGEEQTLVWSRTLFREGAGGVAFVLLAGQPLLGSTVQRDYEAVKSSATDLETELTLISGYCELWLDEGRSSGDAQNGELGMVQQAVQRAMDAVKRLLSNFRNSDRGEARAADDE